MESFHAALVGVSWLHTLARLLGYEDAAELLPETLDEVGAADKKLTVLAGSIINVEAAAAAD